MAMIERAFSTHAYEEAQSFEQRRLRVLDGTAAREKLNARRADVVKIALAVTAVLVYLLAVTMMEAKIGNMVSHINAVQRDIEATANAALRADLTIGQLSSLERVESYATANLGMVRPTVDDIPYLNSESSQMIVAGQQQLTEPEETPQPEEEATSSWWQNIGALLKGYWRGQALAADGK